MKTQLPNLLVLGLVAAFSVGCASSPPTVGDKMMSQAESTRELGKKWEEGKSLVKKGESIKAYGLEVVADGEARVKNGERMIAEGQAMMAESEMVYKARFPGKSLDPDAPQSSK